MTDKINQEAEAAREAAENASIDDVTDPTAEEAGRALAQLEKAGDGQEAHKPAGTGDKSKAKGPDVEEDPRDKIARRAAERKVASSRTFSGDVRDPQAEFGPSVVEDAQGKDTAAQDAAKAAADDKAATDAAAADPEIEVVVDGERRKIKQSVVIASYQKAGTADKRLQEATRLLEEAKNLGASKTTPNTEGRQDDSTHRTPTKETKDDPTQVADMSDEEAAELAEKLQVGSPRDVIEAARKLVEKAVPKKEQTVDVASLVNDALADREEASKSTVALSELVDKTPALKSPHAQALLVNMSHEEMVKDLKTAGVSDKFIASNLNDPRKLVESHKKLRRAGVEGVRSTEAVIAAAGNRFKEFAAQLSGGSDANAKVDISPERSDRKREVQPQPASRTAQPQRVTTEQTQMTSRQLAVQKMREQRGQAL